MFDLYKHIHLIYVDVGFVMNASVMGQMYRLRHLLVLGKVTRKDPDTIDYTTRFWWLFEIVKNGGNTFQFGDRY